MAPHALFPGFPGTMPESDSSPPSILRLATAFTLATTVLRTVVPGRPLRSPCKTYVRAWVLRHRGARQRLHQRGATGVAFDH